MPASRRNECYGSAVRRPYRSDFGGGVEGETRRNSTSEIEQIDILLLRVGIDAHYCDLTAVRRESRRLVSSCRADCAQTLALPVVPRESVKTHSPRSIYESAGGRN